MTLKDAKLACSELGMTLTSRPQYGEFRVNFAGGTEATAYYATDIADAVATARAMFFMGAGNG